MHRHIVDRPTEAKDSTRLGQFLKIEAMDKPHPAPRELHRQPQLRAQTARLSAFTKIERGYRA